MHRGIVLREDHLERSNDTKHNHLAQEVREDFLNALHGSHDSNAERHGLTIRRGQKPCGGSIPPPGTNQPTDRASVRKNNSSRVTLLKCTIFGQFFCNRARTDFPQPQRMFAEQLLHCHVAASPLGSSSRRECDSQRKKRKCSSKHFHSGVKRPNQSEP